MNTAAATVFNTTLNTHTVRRTGARSGQVRATVPQTHRHLKHLAELTDQAVPAG